MRMCRRLFQHGNGTDNNIYTLSANGSTTITLTQPSGVLFVMTRDTSKTGQYAGGACILDYSAAYETNLSYLGVSSLISVSTTADSYDFTITNLTSASVDLMLLE